MNHSNWQMAFLLLLSAFAWTCGAVCPGAVFAVDDFPLPGAAMKTPLRREMLDAKSFAAWDNGQQLEPQDREASHGPQWVLWTSDSRTGHSGLRFGLSKRPGARHLRIGFTESIPVGTVLTRGNVSVSALKADASYPGDLANESLWIAGERLADDKVTQLQPERNEFALWVFPAGTMARALRFTHLAQGADPTYEGWLGGAAVLNERLINLAPQAMAAAKSDNKHAELLINNANDDWNTWENVDERSSTLERQPPVSDDHAEWLMLTWRKPVKIEGVLALWTGFGSVQIQAYEGPAEQHPRDASEHDWKTVKEYAGFQSGYPAALWPNYFPLGQTINTRAIRLRITAVTPADHPHVQRRPAGGKRVWLGELMALQNLGDAQLASPSATVVQADAPHAPIPVRFQLPTAGYVTLVIEDQAGVRVRNLVSETWFPAGENVAWWDGTHDLDRDLDAANHGLYNIPARLVEPGNYTARGLWRKELEAFYEFAVYNSGNPPWSIPDHTGGWLANHSPPSAAVFVPPSHSPTNEPTVLLGSFVTEGPDGFAWVDLDGTKRGGLKWIGGNWTAAPHLGRDTGPQADPETAGYVASLWETEKNSGIVELRISVLKKKENNQLQAEQTFKQVLRDEPEEAVRNKLEAIGGIAAYDGVVACSLRFSNRILLIEAATGALRREIEVASPRGIVFDPSGRLLVLSENKIFVIDSGPTSGKLTKKQIVVSTGLEDPWGITLDGTGRLFVSDHGHSHQVKVFSADGKLLRAIGHAGSPQAGPYDPLHMNHPAGIAIDSKNQLWVTEHDYLPKRVSVWALDGKFVRAIYGPAKYGGGGMLDAGDRSRFLYADEQHGTLEFQVDWEKGTSQLKSVLYRAASDGLKLPPRSSAPEVALHHIGRRYFSNCYSSSPTNGTNNAFLFIERDGIAQPIAAMGLANDWPLLASETFLASWPKEADPAGDRWRKDRVNQAMYLWTDSNGDAQAQPNEIRMLHTPARGFTVMDDLSFCVAQAGDRTLRFRPTKLLASGVPAYDLDAGEVLATGVQNPASTGGAQVLADASDETVITLGVDPFHSHSICGVKNGRAVWSYPNPWPGLHASHHAAKPDRPGQLIGGTRLMGSFIEPKGSQVGPLFALNANMGNFYLFTRDGLFVATVFADSRLGKAWRMAHAERGMNLAGLTLHDENFWPSINQTPDGQIYAVDGSHTCLLRLEGLDSLRPIEKRPVEVSAADLLASRQFVELREAARQQAFGSGVLQAALRDTPPAIDGKLEDWSQADWVEIDRRGDGANFNSNSKPYHVLGALAADQSHLYAAWITSDDKLLRNSGEVPHALFKTGGGLDLMLGCNAAADPQRRDPVAGDLRLLVAQVDGQTRALLYRAVVAGTAQSQKIPFTSPVWSLNFDRVEDVSDRVELAATSDGGYELSVPLDTLGLRLSPGLKIQGDLGVLRGDGSQTTSRSYWSNKATGITADVPSEAKLSPHLWGTIEWK